MSQITQPPEAWAEEDARAHRDRMDRRSEQQVGIFLAVARVVKKWPAPPAVGLNPHAITRADYDAGVEAARRCS